MTQDILNGAKQYPA